jgi:hypothetical protein
MSQMSSIDIDEFQNAIHDALTSWGDLESSDDDLLSFLLLVQALCARISETTPPYRIG